MKSAKVHQIAGQKWQVELRVCEIPLQSCMEQWGSAGQDHMHFSGL